MLNERRSFIGGAVAAILGAFGIRKASATPAEHSMPESKTMRRVQCWAHFHGMKVVEHRRPLSPYPPALVQISEPWGNSHAIQFAATFDTFDECYADLERKLDNHEAERDSRAKADFVLNGQPCEMPTKEELAEMHAQTADMERCIDACRVMREHGLAAEVWMDDETGEHLEGWWQVTCPNGDYGQQHLLDEGYDDPVDALIAAEPLYLAWKERQP